MADENVIKVISGINENKIGITDFKNISGKYTDKNNEEFSLNLQDAINTLMNAAGSTSYVYIGDTAPAGNQQYALWLDTSGQE